MKHLADLLAAAIVVCLLAYPFMQSFHLWSK
jgi:hypothetical protein